VRKYRGFLIDADNTLFDFDRAERSALLETLRYHGVRRVPRDVHRRYHQINERLWREFEAGRISQTVLRTERFTRLLEGMGLVGGTGGCAPPHAEHTEKGGLADSLSRHYLESLGTKGFLLPFARRVLGRLARSASLALLTNGIPEVQRRRLSASGIAPYFKTIVISGEVGLAKPDPRIFALTLRRLEVPAADTLCVGDSPSSDIRGAHHAGVATCWFERGDAEYPANEPPPGYRIRDLRELLGFV
jgi:2-haloacid dehalogenase